LRCVTKKRRSDRAERAPFGRRNGHRLLQGRSGFRGGLRLRLAGRARVRHFGLVFPKPPAAGGFERLAARHHRTLLCRRIHCRDGVCRSTNGKRSGCFARGGGMRGIARLLSTISREPSRDLVTRSGGLPVRHILGAACLHEDYAEPVLLKDLESRHPVDAGRSMAMPVTLQDRKQSGWRAWAVQPRHLRARHPSHRMNSI